MTAFLILTLIKNAATAYQKPATPARPGRTASRLAILPDTTHVTLMQRMSVIVPMVNDFLDAKM